MRPRPGEIREPTTPLRRIRLTDAGKALLRRAGDHHDRLPIGDQQLRSSDQLIDYGLAEGGNFPNRRGPRGGLRLGSVWIRTTGGYDR